VRCPVSTAVAERTTAAGAATAPVTMHCATSPLTDTGARVKAQKARTEETHQCGAPIQGPHPPDPPTATQAAVTTRVSGPAGGEGTTRSGPGPEFHGAHVAGGDAAASTSAAKLRTRPT